MNNHPYLILERSSQNLKTIGDSKKTILEGIFAEFGVENRNGRIYQEDVYLKHLEYLKQDIANGSLLGELDHPDRYEVSLGNASHRIIELWYEPKNRRVMGRIEILENTPKGQIAKALLDANVPLSISSRAAGSVNPDKTVQIHQIYTYDLVAKPGFASAQLYSVSESFGGKARDYYELISESQSTFEKSNLTKNLGIVTDNISILDVSESYNEKNIKFRPEALRINSEKNNKNNMSTEGQNRSNDELYEALNKKIDTLQSRLDAALSESVDRKELEGVKEYVNELKTIQESALNWQADIANGVNKVAGFVDTISKKTNKHINATKKLSEAINYNADVVNNLQEWTGSIAKTTNFLAETVDYNAQVVNHMQDWSTSQAQAINNMHEWTSDIARNLNVTMNYTQDMFGRAISKKDAQQILEYAEALVNKKDTKSMKKKLDESLTSTSIQGIKVLSDQKSIKVSKSEDKGKDTAVKFDEKDKIIIAKGTKVQLTKGSLPKGLKTLDNKTETAPKVTDNYKPKGDGLDILDDAKSKKVPSDKEVKGVGDYTNKQQLASMPSTKGSKKVVATNESFDKSEEISERGNKLNERLSQIANSLQKERAIKESVMTEYPFTRMLSESDRNRFGEMNAADKQRVAKEMSKMPTTDANVIQRIWESAIAKNVSDEPMWLSAAPAQYKSLYENASEAVKSSINARAEFFNLNTQYQIDDFWQKSGLIQRPNIVLNESVSAKPVNNTAVSEVSDNFINQVGLAMQRYNR